jgi:quercetin dioxygenase-like cupin family protein
MSTGHLVRRLAVAGWVGGPEWASGGVGLRRWPVVGEATGAVHTGFEVWELAPDGRTPAHVHSFEESAYVLGGAVALDTTEGTVRLVDGDYGLVPIGRPHAWRNDGAEPARWALMQAPVPRARLADDTIVVPPLTTTAPTPVDVRDPRTRSFGHIEPSNMDVDKQTQDRLAVSASMRTALLVYSGITVKMMVDSDLGAQLSTMFMVQYVPEGVAGPHDHPFEETYLFLAGEVEATFDGERHRLGPGDVAWAGVGCVHSFRNVGTGLVRWLETQAPQPPARHSYRFARDWDYLRSAVT